MPSQTYKNEDEAGAAFERLGMSGNIKWIRLNGKIVEWGTYSKDEDER